MKSVTAHLTRCMIAGVVALLPIGGLVLTVVYLESAISGSYLAEQPWYFPGLGLIAFLVVVYLIGLTVTTMLGRWLWGAIDRMIDRLPVVGRIYATLKQILGYGEGEGALFRRVVLVPDRAHGGSELGLVTASERTADGRERIAVFIPGAPNPGAGRLVIIHADEVTPTDIAVSDALKALVAVGASDLRLTGDAAEVRGDESGT